MRLPFTLRLLSRDITGSPLLDHRERECFLDHQVGWLAYIHRIFHHICALSGVITTGDFYGYRYRLPGLELLRISSWLYATLLHILLFSLTWVEMHFSVFLRISPDTLFRGSFCWLGILMHVPQIDRPLLRMRCYIPGYPVIMLQRLPNMGSTYSRLLIHIAWSFLMAFISGHPLQVTLVLPLQGDIVSLITSLPLQL